MNPHSNPTDKQLDDLNKKQALVRDAMPDAWLLVPQPIILPGLT